MDPVRTLAHGLESLVRVEPEDRLGDLKHRIEARLGLELDRGEFEISLHRYGSARPLDATLDHLMVSALELDSASVLHVVLTPRFDSFEVRMEIKDAAQLGGLPVRARTT